ncbi:MAG: hypothetical protein FJ291_04340 [Planctomycetes bacterium]|nr:hypothetical protein [Planctomycetota bacterium]
MVTVTSRKLVIDVCVLGSAGEDDARDPVSKQCRDFLKAVFAICHRAICTPEVEAEWKKCGSRFARKWRTQMERHSKTAPLPSVSLPILDQLVDTLSLSRSDRKALLKDLHLVKAALAAELVIVSCDNEVRGILRDATGRIPELRDIAWVNPVEDPELVLRWLSEGAPRRQELLVGH